MYIVPMKQLSNRHSVAVNHFNKHHDTFLLKAGQFTTVSEKHFYSSTRKYDGGVDLVRGLFDLKHSFSPLKNTSFLTCIFSKKNKLSLNAGKAIFVDLSQTTKRTGSRLSTSQWSMTPLLNVSILFKDFKSKYLSSRCLEIPPLQLKHLRTLRLANINS